MVRFFKNQTHCRIKVSRTLACTMTMTTTSNPADRLDSWKEIAVYLRRDARTVQRCGKREGLPVYRLQHDKLGSVFAYRSEGAAWYKSRQQLGTTQDPGKIHL